MTLEGNDPKDQPKQPSAFEQDYEGLAVEEPDRDIELIEEDAKAVQSLREKLAQSPNLSDMQTALLRLFPEAVWVQVRRLHELLMVGRIAPDVFMSMLRILVKEAVKRSDPKKPLHVGELVSGIYTVLSIGLDGKGRIDILELAGAAREEEELTKLGGGL